MRQSLRHLATILVGVSDKISNVADNYGRCHKSEAELCISQTLRPWACHALDFLLFSVYEL